MQDTPKPLQDGSHPMRWSGARSMHRGSAFAAPNCRSRRRRKFPWHLRNHVQNTFYVLQGQFRLFLREPKEEVRVGPGETYSVRPRRPHLVTNGGDGSAKFLVLQGMASTISCRWSHPAESG